MLSGPPGSARCSAAATRVESWAAAAAEPADEVTRMLVAGLLARVTRTA